LFPALAALFCSLWLTGCGSAPTHSIPAISNANWQIQAGSSITYPPTGAYLLGVVQTEGSQITGTFTNNNLACSPPSSTYIGSTDTSGELTLKAPFDSATLPAPSAPYSMTTGTLSGGGYLCNATTSGPAVGIEIPPLNGTYTGTLVASAAASGTATLTVAQDSTPNAFGQFLVTGTLQFSSSGCTSTSDLTGTISGTVITLNGSNLTLTSYDTHTGSLLLAILTFTTSGCSTAPYTGPLTLQ
jgi:hypothetical protein